MCITDSRIDVIVCNAFNGMGDTIGEDDFGLSVAWIDLDDYLETYGIDVPDECQKDGEALAAWLKTHPSVSGARWVLAYLDCNGFRDVQGFASKKEMMNVFRAFENEYWEWLEADAENA